MSTSNYRNNGIGSQNIKKVKEIKNVEYNVSGKWQIAKEMRGEEGEQPMLVQVVGEQKTCVNTDFSQASAG